MKFIQMGLSALLLSCLVGTHARAGEPEPNRVSIYSNVTIRVPDRPGVFSRATKEELDARIAQWKAGCRDYSGTFAGMVRANLGKVMTYECGEPNESGFGDYLTGNIRLNLYVNYPIYPHQVRVGTDYIQDLFLNEGNALRQLWGRYNRDNFVIMTWQGPYRGAEIKEGDRLRHYSVGTTATIWTTTP